MPIKIPADLPAAQTLHNENIFTMDEFRAASQDIRPLRILVLNLMPTKIVTETQLARLLGNTPIQVEMELLMCKGHQPKNTPPEHMIAFYQHFDDVKDRYFDGLVITGAPVEKLPFEEVDYWDELCAVMDWSRSHVHSTLHICWGAQAGLYHHYGIGKHLLPQKFSGIYRHHVVRKGSMLMRGFDDVFDVPVSRYTGVDRAQIAAEPQLRILAESEETGVYAVDIDGGRQIFITGHVEYDPDTLAKEYFRDVAAGLNPTVPKNYFPDDDPAKPPVCTWRSCANLLFANWLNYYVYQETPFHPEEITTY